MRYVAFAQQKDFHLAPDRIRGAFAGKRGGKTECGAIESVRFSENQYGYKPNGIDPYLGLVIAPTSDMLRRLSMQKFLAYSKGSYKHHHQTNNEVTWHNNSKIYGISADKPKRMEGVKANWAWIDEVFQVKEQVFLETMARVSDTQGRIWCTGSLGVDYPNPKGHWAYKYFKERPLEGSRCFEWATADNPHFPRDELERLKGTLDPRTFRQMFTLSWDTISTNLVYDDLSEANFIRGYVVNPRLPVMVAIDWGWAHPMAVGFFQYDPRDNTVYLFDEIIGSRITLDQLWDRIKSKGYTISEWFCDIAGNQEREQTGYSNIRWFKEKHGVSFKYRSSAVTYGISVVRPYIKNGLGQRRFFIDEVRCPKSADGIKNYSYQEKDGQILNENPIKKEDDACDMIRYFFINKLDPRMKQGLAEELPRWGKW